MNNAAPPTPSVPRGIGLWIAGARVKTLPAAVVPVAVGTAAAAQGPPGDGSGLIVWRFVAAMVVSLALQVGVNYANDYSDGVRGTDDDRVGPLRLVGSGLVEPRQVKIAAFAAFGVAAVVGLALAAAAGWWLVAVGAAAVAAGWFYTGGSNPYGYLGLGELFVFVFFGLVATVGSAYVQTESFEWLPVVTSVAVGLLACALLVTNNLRDIPSDIEANKRTLAVRLGDARTRQLYVATLAGPFVIVVLCGIFWRPLALIALVGLPLALPPVRTVLGGAEGRNLIPVLEGTAKVQLVVGLLLALGLLLGA